MARAQDRVDNRNVQQRGPAMNQALQNHAATDILTAEIPYTIDNGEKLVNESFGPNNIRRRRTGTQDWRPMSIQNARPLASEFSLERNGFEFVEHPTKVKDFFDPQQLESVYYPEVVALIKSI
jgi:hypothetical protein